jgi:sugar phosphate isomerase/epimerase
MMPNYSVILGNLGNTKDRFCGGYKENPSSLDMLARAAEIPHVSGIELVGTWDIRPDNWREMKSRLGDLNVKCASIIPDLFADKKYWKGSYSAPDAKVRQESIDYTLQLCDIAGEMGCDLLNIWPGQDGYDYLLCADYEKQREWFCDAVGRIATKNPTLKLALEYKPKEPRCFSTIARMADTLLMCQETGCGNVGVCIDTGHAFVAQESVGEAIVLAKRAGNRLFHMHFNDNHGAWDDDMIVGTVHSTCYIEMLYWLDRTGYTGWISMDQYPYREDAAGAIGESIQWLVGYESIVQKHKQTIDTLIQRQDAVETSRFLRRVMLGQ